jgi:hypothetical protein
MNNEKNGKYWALDSVRVYSLQVDFVRTPIDLRYYCYFDIKEFAFCPDGVFVCLLCVLRVSGDYLMRRF